MTPKISAIIPVYNGKKFLRKAIESVVKQTLPPIELIIVDDGSTDDSLSVLDGFEIPFRTIILRQENSGQSRARNFGVEASHGDYIALLDQDDIWYPNHLEKLIKPFETTNSNIGWVYSNLDEIDEKGMLVTIKMLDDLPMKHPKRKLVEMLSNDMFILPSASLIDKKAFLFVGGFDERLSGYEDDDLFLRLFRQGYKNIYLNQSLSKWRIYRSSSSYSPRMANSRRIYAQKQMKLLPDDPVMGRYWVRDCIAPKFFSLVIGEYERLLNVSDFNACKEMINDANTFVKLTDFNHVGRKRRIKLKFMNNPRLFKMIRNIYIHLPYRLRRLIQF